MFSTVHSLARPRLHGVVFLAAAMLVTGCASTERVAHSPHELRSAVATRIPSSYAGQIVVPYEVTPEMIARAREYAGGESSDYDKADALVRAITSSHQFDVQWVPVATTVASETLTNGHGNCLSMTSLFIGLARSLGLSAYYIDASDRINDVQRDAELIVDTGHIAASVRTERGWRLVDFTGGISDYRTFRQIDDIEALAHFYNNRGYERISIDTNEGREIDWNEALTDFELATFIQPDFGRAQNNLGVAYARLGDDEAAKVAYTAAVRSDENFAAPRHNLGNLHLRREDPATAAYWYTLAIKLQKDNPYAHYHLGIALSQAGDIEGSIKAFEKAIALKRDYAEPRVLLAAAFRRQGRMEEAERIRTQR